MFSSLFVSIVSKEYAANPCLAPHYLCCFKFFHPSSLKIFSIFTEFSKQTREIMSSTFNMFRSSLSSHLDISRSSSFMAAQTLINSLRMKIGNCHKTSTLIGFLQTKIRRKFSNHKQIRKFSGMRN